MPLVARRPDDGQIGPNHAPPLAGRTTTTRRSPRTRDEGILAYNDNDNDNDNDNGRIDYGSNIVNNDDKGSSLRPSRTAPFGTRSTRICVAGR